MHVSNSSRIRRGLTALALILSTVALTTTSAAAESENGRPFRISLSSEFLNQAEECTPGGPAWDPHRHRPSHSYGDSHDYRRDLRSGWRVQLDCCQW